MKKITLLHPPIITKPRITVQIPDESSPGLRKLFLKKIDQSKKKESDENINVFKLADNNEEKIHAIKALEKLIIEEGYYDEKIVPSIMELTKDKDLKSFAIESLAEIAKVVSVYDNDLLLIFNAAILQADTPASLRGARILFQRGNYSAEVLRKSISIVEESKDFMHVLEGVAFLNSYLTIGSPSQSDLRLIASIKNEINFNTRYYLKGTIDINNYVENKLPKDYPEIKGLVHINNGRVNFNINKIKAGTSLRIAELVESADKAEFGIIPIIVKDSKHESESIKVNALACMNSITNSSTGVDGKIFQAATIAVNDDSNDVIANSLELLENISVKSFYLAIESEDIFIEFAKNGATDEIKSHALLGLANLLRIKDVDASKVEDLLLEAANYHGESSFLKIAAMQANFSYLQSKDLPQEAIQNYLNLAKDTSPEVREAATNTLFAKMKWGVIPELKILALDNLKDDYSSVRAANYRLISTLIKGGIISPTEVIKSIRTSILSSEDHELSQGLYAFSSVIKQSKLSILDSSDFLMLTRLASTKGHNVSRAATSCLANIALHNPEKLGGTENEDKVEILCKIYGSCLPALDDQYQNDITAAHQILNKRYKQWRRESNVEIATNPASKRLSKRSDNVENLLDILGTTIKQMNIMLIEKSNEIAELHATVKDLEIRLLREVQMKAKLEADLISQTQRLLTIEDSPRRNATANMRNVVVLWFLESCADFVFAVGNPSVFLPKVLFTNIATKIALRNINLPTGEESTLTNKEPDIKRLGLFEDSADAEI